MKYSLRILCTALILCNFSNAFSESNGDFENINTHQFHWPIRENVCMGPWIGTKRYPQKNLRTVEEQYEDRERETVYRKEKAWQMVEKLGFCCKERGSRQK